MNEQPFQAIYERGVLKPLVPLSFPEAALVSGTVHLEQSHSVLNTASDPLQGLMSADADLLD
jgi:predicted DNA-binding antitoxin AbrB/MazE fold protein